MSDMTNNEFKIGDRVASEDAKYSGIVTAVCDMGCKVRFADGEELYFQKDILHHSDLPDYDRKTAFLTELQALLRKYDACIYDYEQYKLCIDIGDEDISWTWGNKPYSQSFLTADNIMDFNKE